MAQTTETFSVKIKDTNPIYTNMIPLAVSDAYITATFGAAVPENGKKAVCYKTVLGYTMRNASLTFQINAAVADCKINKLTVDFAVTSKSSYVADPSYVFNSTDADAWTPALTKIREELIGNRYTTYYRLTQTDPTPGTCTMCSIRFQTNGVFIYDAQVEYTYNDDTNYGAFIDKSYYEDNPEYDRAIVDADDKILYGKRTDGTEYEPDLTNDVIDGVPVQRIVYKIKEMNDDELNIVDNPDDNAAENSNDETTEDNG